MANKITPPNKIIEKELLNWLKEEFVRISSGAKWNKFNVRRVLYYFDKALKAQEKKHKEELERSRRKYNSGLKD